MERKKKYGTTNAIINKSTFTHFISLPLIESKLKAKFQELQAKILAIFTESEKNALTLNNPDLFHITLSMLCLSKKEHYTLAKEIFQKNESLIKDIIGKTKFLLKLGKVEFFEKGKKGKSFGSKEKSNIIFVDVVENEALKKLMQISHIIIKDFIDNDIIDTSDLKSMKLLYDHTIGCFRAEKFHITLFRIQGDGIDLSKLKEEFRDFEFGEVECNSIDISTRFQYDGDKFYEPLFRISL